MSVLAASLILTTAIGITVWLRQRANAARFKELARLLTETPEGVELDDRAFVNDQTDILPYNPKFEIDRDRFELLKRIGDGEFGQVFRAQLRLDEHCVRYVAVKIPKKTDNSDHYEALIGELKIMIYLKPHVNVLSLIGSCTTGLEEKRELFVLTEYCENGSLLGHLQSHRADYERCASTDQATISAEHGIQSLLAYSYQAANGMKYLGARNIIHRDLALRNLLLTCNGVVKISDFGLSRRRKIGYSYKKLPRSNVKLPVAWMALESLTGYEYTHKSDVWSFGVVLWEIFTCGRGPYTDNGVPLSEIQHWLLGGSRLPQPKLATTEMYTLMQECWKANASDRPSFGQCKSRIARHMETSFPTNYRSLELLLSDAACDMNSIERQEHTSVMVATTMNEQAESSFNEDPPVEEEMPFDSNLIDMCMSTEDACPATEYAGYLAPMIGADDEMQRQKQGTTTNNEEPSEDDENMAFDTNLIDRYMKTEDACPRNGIPNTTPMIGHEKMSIQQ